MRYRQLGIYQPYSMHHIGIVVTDPIKLYELSTFVGTKKSKKIQLLALFFSFATALMSAWTGYQFFKKTYNKVTHTCMPRSGEEIYNALFQKNHHHCVKILNYQDQIVPKIDYAIWLQAETCPDELKRILSFHEFKKEIKSTNGWNSQGPSSDTNWFKPESLGGTIYVFTYNKDEYGNGQYIYSSLDSTKIFIMDVDD